MHQKNVEVSNRRWNFDNNLNSTLTAIEKDTSKEELNNSDEENENVSKEMDPLTNYEMGVKEKLDEAEEAEEYEISKNNGMDSETSNSEESEEEFKNKNKRFKYNIDICKLEIPAQMIKDYNTN